MAAQDQIRDDVARKPPPAGAPRAVKIAIASVVVALMAGAAWLLSVRGEALLIDLYATGVRLLCL